MSTAASPSTPLPVRTPGTRARGRHRRPERPELPTGAPALVVAVPAEDTPAARQIADELVSLIRAEQPGIDVTVGYLTSSGAESATLAALLTEAAAAQRPGPVVVPLLPGPNESLRTALAELQDGLEGGIRVTDALGPHPLLAEALHVRLSEAGLARADRARLFAINTSADGIVLGTVGGAESLQLAEVTGVLLAARLAVPVVAAALDQPGAVAAAAAHLRETGCAQPALAPYLFGPEADPELLKNEAAEADCQTAEPLGAYPTVARLVLGLYLAELGLELDPEQG
ncbi:sirohydrochlorin chelatase [Streptacidiphilus sp. N1-12]|uniref:Sirohydrochlorin chelatase n=2 Tax=Streptacidiphilus alkalitolerans TaxID=3342712 RepID=A0ABV6WA75_9ACTN